MSDETQKSARTTLEVIRRKIVDEASGEVIEYLEKLPEAGCGPSTSSPAAEATRERVLRLRIAIENYLA